jgi:uncharacterized repeat protein (TIGR03843 family)
VLLHHLQTSQLELEGYVPWGSNRTFLATLCSSGSDTAEEETPTLYAIYKPQRGERPLWDFPSGTLCQRERAAFLISEALGWHLVPPTIIREDAPHGRGSVQFFIEHNPDEHYFTFQHEHPDQLPQVALFDILINNADRKSGHVLRDEHGRVWLIDHGLTFHHEYKLRTVIWEYAAQPIPTPLTTALDQLHQQLHTPEHPLSQELTTLLSPPENQALRHRLAQLRQTPHFITPGPGRHYPWPLV